MNKKSLTQGLLLLTLLFTGLYVYQTNRNAPPSAMPSGEAVTTDVDPAGAVNVDSQASDVTPNYDPDDPFGVKFGLGGMAVVGMLIVLDWVFKQGVRAVSKKRGGG